MNGLKLAFSDRIKVNALVIILSFLGVLLLSSQSAASYPTYLLAGLALFSFSRWHSMFNLPGD